MGLEIMDPNTCIRGCCSTNSIPLHLQPSAFTLLSPIARGKHSTLHWLIPVQLHETFCWDIGFLWNGDAGGESTVYEGRLDGRKVAVKKPILSTSEELDKFHKELQLLWLVSLYFILYFSIKWKNVKVQTEKQVYRHSKIFFPWSELDHPGIVKLVAANAKPPNYMFFFEYYESPNLAEKLHVEEWNPSINQVLMITLELGNFFHYQFW